MKHANGRDSLRLFGFGEKRVVVPRTQNEAARQDPSRTQEESGASKIAHHDRAAPVERDMLLIVVILVSQRAPSGSIGPDVLANNESHTRCCFARNLLGHLLDLLQFLHSL